jgi:AmmeMemoRadiSam system radical SAM enzyme
MGRRVIDPPKEVGDSDIERLAGWWHESEDGQQLVCDLCPRSCVIANGQRGFCFVRQNQEGRMISTTYGRSMGFCIDPIEKKPLNQFYPGTAILSFGTAGCNLGCKFCQNWSMSRSHDVEAACEPASPDAIASAARRLGCRSVAFTYNDPIIWAEYAIDTAHACHKAGIQTVAVTSGYISESARETFFDVMDAANVDLKGFSEEFYRDYCSGHLSPVLDTLRWLAQRGRTWLEITTLLIPRANDSPDELTRMCEWIVAELGPDVPLHFTAFHPDFKVTDREPTSPQTLAAAHAIAQTAGLRYVYTGNIVDPARQNTYCPSCGQVVIDRSGYDIRKFDASNGVCVHCQSPIAGRFDVAAGTWGNRRMPVRIREFS